MVVDFETRDPEARSLRGLADERLRLSLRRLAWLVARARVQLDDVNGPRGGLDKRCRVELKTDRAGTVVVTAVAGNWRSALEHALARAGRALLRSWQRARLPAPALPAER